MKRMHSVYLFPALFLTAVLLNGCATSTHTQKDLEIQGFKNQISVLEAQLQAKDEEIKNLKESQSGAASVVTSGASKSGHTFEAKTKPSVRQIQSALRKAGYDPGVVDGKMGKQTREAIKEFQKAHHIPVDGKMGSKTWALLRDSLAEQTK